MWPWISTQYQISSKYQIKHLELVYFGPFFKSVRYSLWEQTTIFFISHDSYNHLYVLCYACKTFDCYIVHGLPKYNSKLLTLFIVVVTLNYFPCNFICLSQYFSSPFCQHHNFFGKNLKWNNLDIHKVIINIDYLSKLLDMTIWMYILLCEWPNLILLLIYKYLIITYYIHNYESTHMGHNYKHDTFTQ